MSELAPLSWADWAAGFCQVREEIRGYSSWVYGTGHGSCASDSQYKWSKQKMAGPITRRGNQRESVSVGRASPAECIR